MSTALRTLASAINTHHGTIRTHIQTDRYRRGHGIIRSLDCRHSAVVGQLAEMPKRREKAGRGTLPIESYAKIKKRIKVKTGKVKSETARQPYTTRFPNAAGTRSEEVSFYPYPPTRFVIRSPRLASPRRAASFPYLYAYDTADG